MTVQRWFKSTNRDLAGILKINIGETHIRWKIDEHRTRTAMGRQIKGFFQNTRQFSRVFDKIIVLRDRAGNACHIRFLKSVIADQKRFYLTSLLI